MNNLTWQQVPDAACRLAYEAAGVYSVIQDLVASLPRIKAAVWYNPNKEAAFLSYPLTTSSDDVASYYIALRQIPGVETLEHGFHSSPNPDEPYIRVKSAEPIPASNIFGPVASAMQLKPNAINRQFGGPNPLAATLAGGLLGGAAGYGVGALAEQFLPEEEFERGRLRRNAAIVGALGGSIPGIMGGIDNLRTNKTPEGDLRLGALTDRLPWLEKQSRFTKISQDIKKILPEEALELNELWTKYADEAGAMLQNPINVDQFNRVIWNDLRGQGGFTEPSLAAATTGLLQATSLSLGGANLVTPFDVGRLAMGMGSGYLSGMIVGKTLGALAGLRPEAQRQLQQSSQWSGLLSNVVPLAFGQR